MSRTLKIAPDIVIFMPKGFSTQRFQITKYNVPQVVQKKLWSFVCRHIWVHYGLHLSACFVRDMLNMNSYPVYSPTRWSNKYIPITKDCSVCEGKGYVTTVDTQNKEVRIVCRVCKGAGSYQQMGNKCSICNGSGVVISQEYGTGKTVHTKCPSCRGAGGIPDYPTIS